MSSRRQDVRSRFAAGSRSQGAATDIALAWPNAGYPASPQMQVILISAKSGVQAADPAYRVYDIREKSDRIAHPMTFSNDVRLTLDGFVAALRKGEIPKSKLLLYDNVGKQVVWLQYYLEKHGIKDYAFLKGGVRAVK